MRATVRLPALVAIASLAIAAPAAPPPRPWQTIQMPTAAAVLANWRDPPSEYGPEPYYGIGGVTADSIAPDFDRLKALGFRAVTIQYGKKMPFGYLSPGWFAFLKTMIAEAKRRDMRLWIVDDAGYPSGFAGGKISADAPQHAMKALVAAGRWPLTPGQALDEPAPVDLVAAAAINGVDGEARSVPVRSGRLRFTAPAEGRWQVIAVAHAFRTSPTRSDTNPTGLKDSTRSLIDYLDPAATAAFLRITHEAYKREVGDEFGKTILGFRADEPDYSIQGLPWTPAFFARFEADKRYDPRPFLPALLQPKDARLTPEQALVRADYQDVFSKLMAESFFRQQADWCAENGLQYQLHLNHEEKQIELARSEGDFFRAMQAVQSPGVDAIWHQIWTDTVSDFPRFAASVAHINGRPQAMTESFAAYRPYPDLAMARYIIDQQVVRGINLVEMMFYPAGQPPRRFFADPGFPALARYTQRLTYLMSMGRPDAQIALLQSRGALFMADEAADHMFVSAQRMLSEQQVDYDLIDEDAVAETLKAGRGTLETLSGNRYRTIIVPMADLMPQRVVDRLRAFAQGGGTVLFLGRTPPRIVDRAYARPRAARAEEFAWGRLQPGSLPDTPTPPAQPPANPPTPLVVPPAMRAAVQAAIGQDDLVLATPSTALRYIHRELADARVFLLFNESAAALDDAVTLRGRGDRVEAWDPQSAATTPVASTAVPGGRRVGLTLASHATRVLVLR